MLMIISIVPAVSAQRVCCKSGGGTTWSDSASGCTDSGGSVVCIEGQQAWVKDWGWYDIVECSTITAGQQFGCGPVTVVPYHSWGGYSLYDPPSGYPKWGSTEMTKEVGAEALQGLTNHFAPGNQQQANALINQLVTNPANTQTATQLINLYDQKEAFYANTMIYEFVLRGSGKVAFDSLPATSELQKQAKAYVANIYSRRLAGEACTKSGYTAYDYQWSTCWPKPKLTGAQQPPVSIPKKIGQVSPYYGYYRTAAPLSGGVVYETRHYNKFVW